MKKYLPMATDKVVMKRFLAMTALAVIGLLCAIVVSVGPANAGSAIVRTIAGGGTPPPLPSGTVVVESLSQVALVASHSSGKVQITLLSYERANGLPKKIVKKDQAAGMCRWIGDGTDVPTYYNSGINSRGQRFWFLDHRHVYECGMHKVKCGNLLSFRVPKKAHIVQGIIVLVRSFGRFTATFTARASASAHGTCGSASASARGTATVTGRTRLQARGNARLLANVRATASASATATASVKCSTPPVVTITTPTGTTTVTVTTPPPPPSTTTVVTTTTHTTTSVTTTTVPTTTTTPPPAQHTCQLVVPNVPKNANPYVASATVTGDIAPTSINWDWGDGTSQSGVDGVSTTRSHTYPTPAPGPAGYVNYVIDVHADFGTQKNVSCGMVQFSVPVPPASGTTTIPPPPAG